MPACTRCAMHRLSCVAGEVHALVGENGAGKSTLIKAFTGAVVPDSGEIWFDGSKITDNSPSFSKSLGIAAIYQQPALFPELTVAENIAIGQETAGSVRHCRLAQAPTEGKGASRVVSVPGSIPNKPPPNFRCRSSSWSRSRVPWAPTLAS